MHTESSHRFERGVDPAGVPEVLAHAASLLTQLAGQMPTTGSVFVYDGIRYKVLAANDRRVIRVSAELIEIEDQDGD